MIRKYLERYWKFLLSVATAIASWKITGVPIPVFFPLATLSNFGQIFASKVLEKTYQEAVFDGITNRD